MKVCSRLIALVLISLSGFVYAKPGPKLHLDTITFQVSAETWVPTKTATVYVNVNAAIKQTDLTKVRENMLVNLNKIANAKWHITAFNRNQSNSGLEQVYASAQARVTQAELSNIRSHAKKVSVPGTTYKISSIVFKPSFAEVEKTKAELRQTLLNKIKMQIADINKTYPQQNFSVHKVSFLDRAMAYNQFTRRKLAAGVSNMVMPSPTMSISNKLRLNAVVVLAANRVTA